MRNLFVGLASLVLAITAFAAPSMAQYQSGGAWNGPRGSGYYYNNGGNGGGWNNGAAAFGGALLGSLLGSRVNQQPQYVQPPVVYAAPPTYIGTVVVQQAPQVLAGPPVLQNPQNIPAPRNVPAGVSGEYWDSSVNLVCRAYPVQYNLPNGGVMQQAQRVCQMPSGRWEKV